MNIPPKMSAQTARRCAQRVRSGCSTADGVFNTNKNCSYGDYLEPANKAYGMRLKQIYKCATMNPYCKQRGGLIQSMGQKEILNQVYMALQECGYNPAGQLVGYILSEDPTYITTYNDARTLVRQINRNELLQEIVENYFAV